jgi:hypothetical protein
VHDDAGAGARGLRATVSGRLLVAVSHAFGLAAGEVEWALALMQDLPR